MVPGGTTETIAHFVGLMHLTEDLARLHQHYDNGPHARAAQPWSDVPTHSTTPDRTLEDLSSHRIPNDYKPGEFALIGVGKHKLLPMPPISVPHPHLGQLPPDDVKPLDLGVPSAASVVSEDATPLPPAPQQLLADLDQMNVLANNGTVLMVQTPAVIKALAQLHHPEAPTTEALVEQSRSDIPGWLPTSTHDQPLIDAVTQHDAATAAHQAAATPSVQPGVYSDGTAQPANATFAPVIPTPAAAETPTSHNGMTDPGLAAQTGGNTTANLASILDDHTQHGSLVVMGDAYTTDAIVQTNVLASNADVAVGGDSGVRTITVDGNGAHNLASFGHHDVPTGLTHFAPFGQVQVDTIDGNFYDVKGFTQVNALSSNDVVVQGTTSSFAAVDSGQDTQINALPFSELARSYDIVVVQGSFHNSNVILQQNVFLNDDVVRAFTGRGDTASQTITTGDNTLQNSASIDHYGTTAYQPLSPDMQAWITQLQGGVVDPGLAASLPSAGSSVLHALVIKGDFYDINAIEQTNIVSNADTAVQYLPDAGAGTAPNGATTTSTQLIDAGHNQLANLASIAVVGTTGGLQFVGGGHYDDAILVQANLVSDKTHVTVGDTHTLASEMAAFTGLHDLEPLHGHAVAAAIDPSLHHDLFHGIMT